MKLLIYAVVAHDHIDSGDLRAVTADKQEAETIREKINEESDVSYTIIREFTVILSSLMLAGEKRGKGKKAKSKADSREL